MVWGCLSSQYAFRQREGQLKNTNQEPEQKLHADACSCARLERRGTRELNGGTTSPWSCRGSRLRGLEGWLLSAAKRDTHEALRERVTNGRGCHKQAW